MACYAAVLSLFHTLNNIKIHPRPPISLDQNQVESLTQNLTFFQDFLERYSSEEDDELESRIKAAAYAAEDVIETRIVDQIDRARSTSHDHGENISSIDLYGVIQEMDLIKKEVMEIIQGKMMTPQHHHLHTNSFVSTASTWQSSATPVFDDAMINQVLDKLTGQQSSLQIISIVGMGGIGKTTLATTLYTNPLIVEHFDNLAWVTISQEYSRRNILQVLCVEVVKGRIKKLSKMSEDEIGEILHKHLFGRRYLIVMDDIWSIEAWDQVRCYFPQNNNGSRIMMTTRLSNLAFELSGSHAVRLQFLDEHKSWDLLCEIVFGELDCPIELESIGKEIVIKCRGLPLSIVVIGGLLKKSNMTQAYWIYTLENLSSLVNLEKDEYTLRILRTSYKELPMHVKPCFLYMGILSEDYEIVTSVLIELWVAEGILRPTDDKSLEEVGKEYLKELMDRNLILILELRWNGEARLCKIHDLLRDVCLREAQKQKFFCVLKQQKHHTPQGTAMERRICIFPEKKDDEYSPEFLRAVEFASLARSLIYKSIEYDDGEEASLSLHFRLLRVYSTVDGHKSFVTDFNDAIFEQANLRYLSMDLDAAITGRLLSSCSLLWNLQTLKVDGLYPYTPIIASAIWEMPLLRHVMLNEFVLPDPLHGEHKFVLENLHTLSRVRNFKFSEEAVKRIPNIKKLKASYGKIAFDDEEGFSSYCFDNLGCLQKLESLNFELLVNRDSDIEDARRILVSFPHSLRKLTLRSTQLSWEELTTQVGPLPLLQVLKLGDACVGPKWETVEGQFCSLRVLHIEYCGGLQYWDTDSAHFPRLEQLSLQVLPKFEGIPSSIGYITTLKSIRLVDCNTSAEHSAKRIKREQKENGNEDIQLIIVRKEHQVHLEEEEDEVDSDEEDKVDSDEEVPNLDEEDQVDSDEEALQENEELPMKIFKWLRDFSTKIIWFIKFPNLNEEDIVDSDVEDQVAPNEDQEERA